MPATRTMLVCLPAQHHPPELAGLAADRLAQRGLTASAPVPHFAARTRRTRRLLDGSRHAAAGGPLRLLDLDGMRCRAQAHAAGRWLVWRDVVAGTGPAQPYWTFADRHHANPVRWPLAEARDRYLAQPRVAAMAVYNALPHRLCHLPLADLEAFQLGHAGYAWLAWLAAVPADGIAATDGGRPGLILPTGRRLAERIGYLHAANAQLAGLHPTTNLVAMAIG
jgi:hypothetical protein